jgi:hypothetical protein
MEPAGVAADAQPVASLGPAQLIKHCETFYNSYDPGKVTLDTHTDHCLESHNVAHPDDAVFLRQVLYGLFRYKKLLSSMIESFLQHNRYDWLLCCS